jgi:hypothetical protein
MMVIGRIAHLCKLLPCEWRLWEWGTFWCITNHGDRCWEVVDRV